MLLKTLMDFLRINFAQEGPEPFATPLPTFKLKQTPALHTKQGLAELDLELLSRKEVSALFFLVFLSLSRMQSLGEAAISMVKSTFGL